jgi:predicted DNA-binding transcriptional regulator AlpA
MVAAVRARQRGLRRDLPLPVPTEIAVGTPRLERFLTLHETMAASGQSKAVIYRKMARGLFPKNLRLEVKPGAFRSIAVWVESEVIQWQQAEMAKRSKGIADHEATNDEAAPA